MKKLAIATLLLSGCEKDDPLFCENNPGASGCIGMQDAPPGGDADIDADPTIDARLSYGEGAFEVSLASAATGQINFASGSTINTSGGNPCLSAQAWAGSQPDACFVVGATITIDSLEVSGTRPLVLVAADTITVNGTIDGASHNGGNIGPGAPFIDATCDGNPAASNADGGGGGAGGSFATKGGEGGKGNSGNTNGGVAANAAQMPGARLRAGCSGQTGGTGGTGGIGGVGGGAIYLVAGNKIDLSDGVINVSGAGGGTGGGRGGGGGGGAGGMIVLYAPTITTDGNTRLVANGGGGAGGANGGSIGQEPNPSNPATPAGGGSAGGSCASSNGGGSGLAGSTAATNGGNSTTNCGGGGGGGGGGYIQTNVALPSGQFSPNPIIAP